ncbi:MAG: hypothetical protein ABWY36_03840 [Leifsonia sp.]
MNDDNELDPVARLRAADPAAAVEPRAGFVDDVIARTTVDTTAPAPVTDLGAERARRRPRWLPIVAVAASIAIFGAAGYAVGASTGGGANLADGAAPPISMQGISGGTATDPGAAQRDAMAGAAPESQKMAGSAASMLYPYGFGRNSFSSSGLSTTDGTALAYTFDARASSNAATVTALAAALGVAGRAELTDGAWTVGPQDGTAPSLRVGLDGTLSFSYSDPRVDPWQCTKEPEVTEPCEPATAAALPGEDAATAALRTLIATTGRDPEAFEYTSDTWEGAVTRTAQAWPVVDGQRVDQPWTIELATDGVLSAYGALADIVPLGDYAVVSEQEAFERLSDPRFAAQMTNLPIALRDQASIVPDQWVAPTEPPATPSAGAKLSWPVNRVEIVSARLGLASQWQPDGTVLVVPAYEFTDAAGGTWSVIAVADSKLDFATE